MEYRGWAIVVLLLLHLLLCNGENVQNITPKPVIKTSHNENGQIFDCVGINLQPALEHPLLKNHTIQMRPSSFPNGLDVDVQSTTANFEAEISTIACPSGTIPILKNYKGARSFRSLGMVKGVKENNFGNYSPYIAMLARRQASVYGSQATISVYEPDIGPGKPPRYSGAVVQVLNGNQQNISAIIAGWFVDPNFYGDNHAHFEIEWSDQGKVCTNLRCPGFVQVNSKISPGSIITPVSTVNGTQYTITVKIFKDIDSGNWWLSFGNDNQLLGYWPKTLFTHMAYEANQIYWSGVVEAAPGEPYPPMGSGELPAQGGGEAAFFSNIKMVDVYYKLVVPDTDTCFQYRSDPTCYDIGSVTTSDTGLYFYFGGGGGCRGAGS